MSERAEYVAGLRALADALEGSDLVLPWTGSRITALSVYAETAADFLGYRALLQDVRQEVVAKSEVFKLRAQGRIGGLVLCVHLHDHASLVEPASAVTPAVHLELELPRQLRSASQLGEAS